MNPNYKFRYLLWLAGILVAVMGAAFSIFGLSKVFATYAFYIIILGIGIEIGKIVGISHLTQNWNHIKKINKWILSFMVGVLMFVTSVGVFGFLSNAYQSTAYQLENVDKKIAIVQNKKQIFVNEIDMYNKQIQTKQDRATKLSNLREKQEKRIDDLYGKDMTTAAKSTQKFIGEADQNINDINKDIATTSNKISQLNDSVIKYDMIIAEMANNQYAVDLGPLKYLAKATGYSMDTVVGFFILLLILVVDPLAVVLIISANELIVKYRLKKMEGDKNKENVISDDSFIQANVTRVTPITPEIKIEIQTKEPEPEIIPETISEVDVIETEEISEVDVIETDIVETEVVEAGVVEAGVVETEIAPETEVTPEILSTEEPKKHIIADVAVKTPIFKRFGHRRLIKT